MIFKIYIDKKYLIYQKEMQIDEKYDLLKFASDKSIVKEFKNGCNH